MDALKEIVNSNLRGGSSGGMTNTTRIGLPEVCKGDDQRYGAWKAKLFAFLRVSTPQTGHRAAEHDRRGPYQDQEVTNFGNWVHAILLTCTE